MEDGTINFSTYTDEELREVANSINDRKYPLNYARLMKEVELRRAGLSAPAKQPAPPATPSSLPPLAPPGQYVPNHIPPEERLRHLVLSLLLLIYGGYGVYVDDLYIPEKRGPGTHFHGDAAWFAYGAIVCIVGALLSIVVDHYDKRDNEAFYSAIAICCQIGAFGLLLTGHIVQT